MAEDDKVRLDTRLSGQIRRYHTWPIVRDQSIGEHSWQLLRIYFAIAETPDMNMVYHIVFHDIGEAKTGDMPFPIKKENPNLKKEMDFLESKSYYAQLGFWDSFRQVLLTDSDKQFMKQLELVEMWEFGLDEVNLGNNLAFVIAERCLKRLYNESTCPRLIAYVIRRIRLWEQQCPLAGSYDLGGEWWYVDNWEKKYESERTSDRRDSLQDSV